MRQATMNNQTKEDVAVYVLHMRKEYFPKSSAQNPQERTLFNRETTLKILLDKPH